MSGNDAANALADMIGGYDTAVAKMNAKAASTWRVEHARSHAVRAGRAAAAQVPPLRGIWP